MIPEQKIGSYILLQKLGSGGLGEVWKARDPRLNRVVALKFITVPQHGSSAGRDLLREARASSALNHPNIITIFDIGESEGTTYLAMEFVDGHTLRDRLKQTAISWAEATEIAQQMAAALAAAHAHGIIHRDLKPENVMLRVDGLIKLVDFGLAKMLPWGQGQPDTESPTETGEKTDTGQLVGTFTYMSPEQARGLAVTQASDVFSFGIVLYEMLAGEHPFRCATALDTLHAILNREPPPISARRPEVPAAVQHVVEQSLQKESSARFPSGRELLESLQRARNASGSVTLTEAPRVRRPPRWLQAVGALAIAGVLTAGTWIYRTSPGSGTQLPVARSVAVMTFRSAPDDTQATALAQGLPDELSSALASSGMAVASRGAVLEMGETGGAREVGERLGVDAVLEGTVRSYGNKFKVHIELVSTRTRFQIWSGTFTADSDDLLGGEQKTAAEVAAQIRAAMNAGKGKQ